MIAYLLKASIVLLCLVPAYWLLLRCSDRYQLNRFLLLLGVAATLLLPVLPLPSPLPPASKTMERLVRDTPVFMEGPAVAAPTDPAAIIPVTAPSAEPGTVPPTERGWTLNYLHLYGLVSGILLSFLIYKLGRMWSVHRRSAVLPGHEDCRLLEEGANAGQAFTFGQTVYLSANLLSTRDLPLILRHERVHARQLHALDILVGELFLCFFWFHPGAWWLRRAQRANLEYLADEGALQQTTDRRAYQLALVRQSIAGQRLALALPFSEPSLKSRIQKMGQNRKQRMIVGLAAMGLLGWLVVAALLINGREAPPVLFPGADSVAKPGGAARLIENHTDVYTASFAQSQGVPAKVDKFELYFRRLPTPSEYAQIKAVLRTIPGTNFSIYQPCHAPGGYVAQLDHYYNMEAVSSPLKEGELMKDHLVLKLVPNGPLGATRAAPDPVVGRFTPYLKYTTTEGFARGDTEDLPHRKLIDYRKEIVDDEIVMFINDERLDFIDSQSAGLPGIDSYQSLRSALPVPPNARLGCIMNKSGHNHGIQKIFWNDVDDHKVFAETDLMRFIPADPTERVVRYFYNDVEMSRADLFAQDFPRRTITQVGHRPNEVNGEIIVQIIDDMPWN